MYTISRSTRSKFPVPASTLSCAYLYQQLERVRFTMTYPLRFQNTSHKCTSRTKSVCLKDTLVTGALLRNSAIGSRSATTVIFDLR